MCAWCIPAADALKIAQENPERQVVFFADRLRDHHAADCGGDQAGAGARA